MKHHTARASKLAALVLAVGALLPAAAVAQGAAAVASLAPVNEPAKRIAVQNVLSINPFGVVFNVYSAEYERALGGNVSIGVASTLWRSSQDYDDPNGSVDATVDYFSADAKLRYYPTAALRGFSVGGLFGATRLGGDIRACDDSCEEVNGSDVALSTGVEIDYAWRLGASQKFYIATGIGAKRLYPLGDDVDATLAYPFARFSIGFGF